ncbi:hypothetical protein CRE_19236 [Caenorhabditis remanei]|uniref:Uncharacterized protein n=1 Tax=Caenorhabditis remanei TaxID=31234 RepID=E3MJM3_CAERE|nr:hypothetical protein CRE_19236 [Caenorhabditis remanei]
MSRRNPVRNARSTSRYSDLNEPKSEFGQVPDCNLFVVERILNKRTTRNGPEFLIKWKGFPETDSSWEPRKNLQCDRIIEEYERMAARVTGRRPQSPTYERPYETRRGYGFVRGDTSQPSTSAASAPSKQPHVDWVGKSVVHILGMTKAPGTMHFLCKMNDGSVTLVPDHIVHERFPNQSIKFYESRLVISSKTFAPIK